MKCNPRNAWKIRLTATVAETSFYINTNIISGFRVCDIIYYGTHERTVKMKANTNVYKINIRSYLLQGSFTNVLLTLSRCHIKCVY